MILTGTRFLDSSVFNRITQTLANRVEQSQALTFLNRTPIVPAYDDELTGRFTGRIFAADIIANDQEAVTYEFQSVEAVRHAIPNIKVGAHLTQADLNRISMLNRRGSTVTEENAMETFENRRALNLILGVRQRMNAMCAMMWLDQGVYNRLGIQFAGSFGTPAALKVTLATPLTNAGATLISAVNGVNQLASDSYGIRYNRIQMSTLAFQYWVNTTEFKSLALAFMPFSLTTASLNTSNVPQMQSIAENVMRMTIELEDTAINEREPGGAIRRTRVMPNNKAILSNTANDNDPGVMDFGNGIVTESIVASLTGNAPEGLDGEQFGPIGYYESDGLNPPDVTAFAVARGIPRKHMPEATAVVTLW